MSDRLIVCAEKLEKLAGEDISKSIVVLDCGIETKEISLPILNAHGSIVKLIRGAMEKKNVEDFTKLPHFICIGFWSIPRR